MSTYKPRVGPTGLLSAQRAGNLRKILSKSPRAGLNVDQLIADLECIDALKMARPEWIKKAEEAGGFKLMPATISEVFAPQIADKKRLASVRNGLKAMKDALADLPPDKQRSIAREAFESAANADADAAIALQALLGNVLAGITKTIAAADASMSPSDEALQRASRIAAVAAAFHKHGVGIGTGEASPFVLACKEFRLSRNTIRTFLPQIRKEPVLEELVKAFYMD